MRERSRPTSARRAFQAAQAASTTAPWPPLSTRWLSHRSRQLGEEQVHRHGRDLGQDRRDAGAALGADRAEQVRRGEAMLAPPTRAHALLVPDVGRAALLADAGLVLEPQLHPRRLGMSGGGLADQPGQAFLKRSRAAGSAPGWTGRDFCRERSRRLTNRSIPLSP